MDCNTNVSDGLTPVLPYVHIQYFYLIRK